MVFSPSADLFRYYDNGTHDGSNPLAAEDVDITINIVSDPSEFHLRWRIQETGGTSGLTSDDWQLQYSKNSGTWTNITTTSSNVRIDTDSNLVNGSMSSERLTAGTGTYITGVQEENNGEITNYQLTANNYTEFAYACDLQTGDLTDTDTLDFRINHSVTGVTPTSGYPRVTIEEPTTVILGISTETDSALTITPVGGPVTVVLGQPTETDSALTITPVGGPVTVQLGIAIETDSALPITPFIPEPLIYILGIAEERNEVFTITPKKGPKFVPVRLAGDSFTAYQKMRQ